MNVCLVVCVLILGMCGTGFFFFRDSECESLCFTRPNKPVSPSVVVAQATLGFALACVKISSLTASRILYLFLAASATKILLPLRRDCLRRFTFAAQTLTGFSSYPTSPEGSKYDYSEAREPQGFSRASGLRCFLSLPASVVR